MVLVPQEESLEYSDATALYKRVYSFSVSNEAKNPPSDSAAVFASEKVFASLIVLARQSVTVDPLCSLESAAGAIN